MLKRVLIATGIAGVVAAGSLVWAGQHGAGPLAADGHCRFGQKMARLRIEFMADRALRAADATPEQRAKVEAILEKAFADHARFRQQHRAMHADALEIFSADTIDRNRIEELRVKHLQVLQQGSRHFATVLADAAEVLTPEQRQKLAAHVKAMTE